MTRYDKLNLAISNKGDGIILVEDVLFNNSVKKNYIVYKDFQEILPLLKTNNKVHCHEIFLENKNCSYFQDIDLTEAELRINPLNHIDFIINSTKNLLVEYISNQDIIISSSSIKTIVLQSPSTDKKDSFHIIYRIKGVYFFDYTITKNFYEWITKIKKISMSGVDGALYSKNHTLRILNSSKIDFPDNKLQILDSENYYKPENLLETLASYSPLTTDTIIINNLLPIKKIIKKKIIPLEEEPEIDMTIELLKCLNEKYYEEFYYWNKIGILLYCVYKGSDIGKDIWDAFSRQSKKYSTKDIDTFWSGYSSLTESSMTIGSLYFYAKESNPERYSTLKESLFDNNNYLSSCNYDIAKLFHDNFSNKYIYSNNSWYWYNKTSGIWKIEDKDCTNIHIDMSVLVSKIKKSIQKDKDYIKSKNKVINTLKNHSNKVAIIQELKPFFKVEEAIFNRNKKLFPFTNGVYDLENNIFRPAYFEEYSSNTCGYPYRLENSLKASAFMNDFIISKELREYILTIVASHLVDEHLREEFFFFYDRSGRNGKSTFFKIMSYVFGNFYYQCKSNILTTASQKDSGEGASPVKIEMKGKRFVNYHEVPDNVELDIAEIKSITGGDKQNGRKLYGEVEEYYINAMQTVTGNKLPSLNKVDPAIIRRLRCIPCSTEFVDNPIKQNQRQIKDINCEELKYSFFQLLIENYNPFIKKGIENTPLEVRTVTEEYLNKTDEIKVFIETFIIKDEKAFIKKNKLQEIFNNNNNRREYRLSKYKFIDFIKEIEFYLDKKFVRKTINNKDYKNILLGYKLLEEIDSDSD